MNCNNLTANVKAVFKCDETFKDYFKDSHCLLTISVGQEVHEGDKFVATILLVNQAFGKCTICVDDSLQRHTMGLANGSTADDCYQQSIIEGDNWLARNKHIYTQLTISYDIIRWNKWLYHPLFSEKHQFIVDTYNSDKEYNAIFNSTVDEFITRYHRRLDEPNNFDLQRGFEICRDYLFEECAALCLWALEGYQFEVYPSKRNAIMSATHEKFIVPNIPNVVNAVAIKFKNRKQLKPQLFGKNLDVLLTEQH